MSDLDESLLRCEVFDFDLDQDPSVPLQWTIGLDGKADLEKLRKELKELCPEFADRPSIRMIIRIDRVSAFRIAESVVQAGCVIEMPVQFLAAAKDGLVSVPFRFEPSVCHVSFPVGLACSIFLLPSSCMLSSLHLPQALLLKNF